MSLGKSNENIFVYHNSFFCMKMQYKFLLYLISEAQNKQEQSQILFAYYIGEIFTNSEYL